MGSGRWGSFAWILSLPVLLLVLGGCGDDEGPAIAQTWSGDPVVQTAYGAVRGFEDDAGTWSWKAIPYARPPVGPLRWKAPREPEPWEGIREERDYCESCAQYFFIGSRVVGSEDCLYLNVWRPRNREAGLPVYFWIHGGGNSIGTAGIDDYDGANLAAKSNLVVVTVNYRLGPFGWFTHPALREGLPESREDDSGNYGTLDLIQALRWVKQNIRAFGGDPNRVMIAGESAGAMNVFSLLVSPLAEGLFQRAMAESGAPVLSSVEEGEESARQAILDLLVRDGTAANRSEAETILDGMSPSEVETYLRSKDARELLSAYEPWFGGMITLPNLFMDGTVLPTDGYGVLDTGDYPNKVPVILGSNKEEVKLFILGDPYFWGRRELYQVVGTYGSDMWKAVGVDQVARRLRSNPDQPGVYAYQFLWGAIGEDGKSQLPAPYGFKLGSFHGLEIPFFFGNDTLFVVLQDLLFTEANRPGRQVLTRAMMHYAARFALTGDPNPPGSGLPEWSAWSNEVGGPKCILFDVDADQALDVRMSTVELTVTGVQERMAEEVPEPLYSRALDYLEQWGRLFSEPG